MESYRQKVRRHNACRRAYELVSATPGNRAEGR
jgi:hypothetical protein